MSEPVYIKAMFTVDPKDATEIEQAMLQCVKGSRKEKACQTYEFFRDREHEGRFYTYEIWASKEGLDTHMETPHFQIFANALKKLDGDLAVTTVTPLNPDA